MATDLAEFLGGAIGLALLFNMPLIYGMAVTAVVTYGILMFERGGFRPMELVIGALVLIIGACYLIELFIAPIDWGAAAFHTFVPQMPDAEALMISVGIIGATVMPHAIYLHSGLTQARVPVHNAAERRKVLRFSNIEVVVALAIAGTGQHGDGDDGVGRLPCRTQRGCRDRDRLPHADAAARRRRGGRLPRLADRLRHVEFGRRHHGRSDDHAGLRQFPHSRSGCAAW